MAADESFKVGVIGVGWAGQQHLAGYQALPGVDVVGLADSNPGALHAIADSAAVPGRFTDWCELIAQPGLDAVSVATPTFLHAPMAIAALDAGLHVLSEKPLARTGDEAAEISDAAKRAGRVLEVCFNHRRRGDVSVLKRHVDAGDFGRIYHAKAHWLRRSGIPGLGSWFTSKELAGGGPMLDIGIHVLDMAMYLLGEPQTATVSAATHAELGPAGRGGSGASKSGSGNAFEVEDIASAFIRLESGATLTLETSWAGYAGSGDSFGVTLFGTEGGAVMNVENYAHAGTVQIYADSLGDPVTITPQVPNDGHHAAVVREFVDTVRSGDWTGHTGDYGVSRARIIDACYESARTGHEVETC